MTQEENEKLMYASKEDQIFYLKCVEGLPTLAGLDGSGNGSDGVPLPFGLGPHSVKCLREIAEIVQPEAILEVGFNMGYSSALWLELCGATVFSVDISDKKETLKAAEILTRRYKNSVDGQGRFHFMLGDSGRMYEYFKHHTFDLIFIDGDHMIEGVKRDIQLSLDLEIPFIAFDDILIEFGNVKEAIDTFGNQLELMCMNGNIALYKNKTI